MAEGLSKGVIKHQVARFQIFHIHVLRDLGLVFGPTWKNKTNGALKDGSHKATAIKTGGLTRAPGSVGHAQQAHGIDHQTRGGITHVLAQLLDLIDHARIDQELFNVLGWLALGCRPREVARKQ